MARIQQQFRLPLSVAFSVVTQGIRIRLGRSLVTVAGVILGIAFLMSILAGQVIKASVAEEEAFRQQAARMLNFLLAETGPLEDKVVRVHGWTGPLRDPSLLGAERRLLHRLTEQGVKLVRSDTSTVVEPAAELFVGNAQPGQRSTVAHSGGVVAATRLENDLPGVVRLDPAALPEDLARRQVARQREHFRAAWILVISLLVTVIGISNAMLMSVTERFREIGTMKCLGALSAFIRRVFVIESILIGLVGSLAGVLSGLAFSLLAYGMTYGLGLVLGSLDVLPLLLSAAGSVAAGVLLSMVAAIYPASYAARMVPADALRSNV